MPEAAAPRAFGYSPGAVPALNGVDGAVSEYGYPEEPSSHASEPAGGARRSSRNRSSGAAPYAFGYSPGQALEVVGIDRALPGKEYPVVVIQAPQVGDPAGGARSSSRKRSSGAPYAIAFSPGQAPESGGPRRSGSTVLPPRFDRRSATPTSSPQTTLEIPAHVSDGRSHHF